MEEARRLKLSMVAAGNYTNVRGYIRYLAACVRYFGHKRNTERGPFRRARVENWEEYRSMLKGARETERVMLGVWPKYKTPRTMLADLAFTEAIQRNAAVIANDIYGCMYGNPDVLLGIDAVIGEK